MNPAKPPCKRDCPGRSGTCHDTCEEFVAWKKALVEAKRALRKEASNAAAVTDIHIGAVKRSKGGHR